MSFTIYSDPKPDGLTSWIKDLKVSEDLYKPQLLNLLTCISISSSNTATTRAVQKLIETHNELNRFLFDKFSIDGFLYWLEKSIPIYAKFLTCYKLTKDMIDMEIQLMKQPLIRINQLYKHSKELNLEDDSDYAEILLKYKKLLNLAKDKNEFENLNLDLNEFYFNDIMELHDHTLHSLQYFKINDILERDYFEFKLVNKNQSNDFMLIEVLKLKQNQLALCSMREQGGRSLMFPLFKINEFDLIQNDLELIHLCNKDFDYELILKCPEIKQMYKWNGFVQKLHGLDLNFTDKLNTMKLKSNNKIGCGLRIDENEYDNYLRKSSTLETVHDSLLESLDRSPLMDITNRVSPITSNNQTQEAVIKPIVSLQDIQPAESLQDKFDKYKTPLQFEKSKTVKKRRSIFNLFKKSSDTTFDIMVKSTSNNSSPNNSSLNDSVLSLNSKNNSSKSTTASNTPKETMASLNRNFKNLTINTKNVNQNTELPSPFIESPLRSSVRQLTTDEEVILSSSNVIKIIKNSIILSKWNSKIHKWEIIGSSNNIFKFLINEKSKEFLISFNSNNSKIPDLLIPLNNKFTNISKSNAKDLQLKCLDSINSGSKQIILTLRCSNVSTLNEIYDQFDKILNFNNNEKSLLKSDSYSSEIFDNNPSNSTSMSSLSNLQDDILSLGRPSSIYGLKQNSLSTLSLPTPTTVSSSKSPSILQNLLLKKDIKIKLHKLDKDNDWIPVTFGFFTIYSNLINPEFSKFEIKYNEKETKLNLIVKNSNCSRIGKSGMIFESIDEYDGDELKYLLEFRNNKECTEIYELLV